MALPPGRRFNQYVACFDAEQRRRLYTDEFAACVDGSDAGDLVARAWDGATGATALDKMLEVDVTTYLPGDLLVKMDIATMAYGLEARSPLLDHELMELAASVPAELKLRGRQKKAVLRDALRPWLPDSVLDRTKQGFSIPAAAWFRADLGVYARDVLLDPATRARGHIRASEVSALFDRHASGAADESRRLWALLMLELWHRECIDRRADPALAPAA